MPDLVKVLIGVRNGTELGYHEEFLLVPENIVFSDPGFTATDVKAAIIESKTVTGVDEDRMISVKKKCNQSCKPVVTASLLVDQSLCWIKKESC